MRYLTTCARCSARFSYVRLGSLFDEGPTPPARNLCDACMEAAKEPSGLCLWVGPDGESCREPVLGSLGVCYDHAAVCDGVDCHEPRNPWDVFCEKCKRGEAPVGLDDGLEGRE